jgi:hypothetical protein
LFDIVLALLRVGVAVSAWRRSPWLEGAATAAATLLLVDAWFDVLTASSRSELAAEDCAKTIGLRRAGRDA